MAFFGRKKKETPAEQGDALVNSAGVALSSGESRDLTHVLKHARITEKAGMQQGAGVYTFDIGDASKRDVMQAVKKLYGVTPRKVAVVNIASKTRRSMRTGKTGVKSGGRKAYVYLKSGERINL